MLWPSASKSAGWLGIHSALAETRKFFQQHMHFDSLALRGFCCLVPGRTCRPMVMDNAGPSREQMATTRYQFLNCQTCKLSSSLRATTPGPKVLSSLES